MYFARRVLRLEVAVAGLGLLIGACSDSQPLPVTIHDNFGGVKRASSGAVPKLTVIAPGPASILAVGETLDCDFAFETSDRSRLPSVLKVSLVRDGVTRAEVIPEISDGDAIRVRARLTAPNRPGDYQVLIEGWDLVKPDPNKLGERRDVLREVVPIRIVKP